jgi:UDP-N-acetyl-D-mannosaminuronic acid dehydrogenase
VSRERTLAVVGTGRVGLPLALCFADAGYTVHGLDVDEERVGALRAGRMPFLEEGAEPLLRRHIGSRFLPGADASVVADCDTIVVTLGTPVDEHLNPAYARLERVINSMLPHLREGQLLVLRSTIAPGTTRYLRRYLESHTRFSIGRDFFLTFCPERIAEGKAIQETREVPQIIGSLDDESGARAATLFSAICPSTLRGEATAAELAKLFCNMYRYIDFAIANEFMVIAMQFGANIYEAVDLANRDYKRAGIKLPGLTAGPCLYKDGFFLVDKVPFADLISVAWKINETVPAVLVERIKRERDLVGARALILGLAFKRNIDDSRNSLSYKFKKILEAEGCDLTLHDPLLAPGELPAAIGAADVVVVAMNHDHYRDLGRQRFASLLRPDAVVCDIWNLFGDGQIVYRARDLQR